MVKKKKAAGSAASNVTGSAGAVKEELLSEANRQEPGEG
jgi:hypothetical protein